MQYNVEPFASAEIDYRRDRIRAGFARANVGRASRPDRRASRPVVGAVRRAYRPAGARG